jgi:antitoxin (DNA-binding transcriptional repressor) of toxin-antitoxin stability system
MKTIIMSVIVAVSVYFGINQFLLKEGELIGRIAALQKQEQQAQALAAKLPELKSQLNDAVAKATAELREKKSAAAAVDKVLQAKLVAYAHKQKEELALTVANQPVDELVEAIENKVQAAVQRSDWEEWELPPFVTEAEKALLQKHWFKK